jgi:DNA-directed RNA polymerase specialized sigma24 family protein
LAARVTFYDTRRWGNVTMMRTDEGRWLAERFEEHRARLRAVAYRMLGSLSDADDAVQDAWVRFSRSGSPRGCPRHRPLTG